MSSICPILRASFDDYLRDALPAPQRRILREHLAACVECRDLAAAKDPTFLFARPMPAEVGAPEAAQILSAVRTGVALIETERRIGYRSSRSLAGAAAVAAALGLLVFSASSGHSGAGARVAARTVTPAGAQGLQPAALPVQASAATTDATAATVYDLNPGAGREEPRVVWIVDRGLDI